MYTIQFSSVSQSCPTFCNPWSKACQTSQTNSHSYPNSCPLSQWCHPIISSSVIPFSSCPQSFPSSGSFQMSQLFTSGGQSIGVSASTSVLPMNTQDWYPLGWTSRISLQLYTINCIHFVISVSRFVTFKATSMCLKVFSKF